MSGSLYPTLTAFTPGDLVISVSGDGDGSGTYTDNQASAITLYELTTTGTVVGQLVLPQTTSVNAAGTTEYAISGEYGSSSEGTLELSADGQSLVIAGYGINANTFNTAEASGGGNPYGNAALAQTTSVQGGSNIAVPRVIADIRADGTVDTSTALYNVDNTNNPRSVATVNGSSFYLSGQGVKGDTTQGVFLAQDGASSATAISTADDTRTVEIYNNTLYVSQDSKQGPTANVATFGTLPTATTADTPLPGISQSVTLAAGQGNSVNGGSVGSKVYLSPENFFFANSTTLYVADGGNPKQGGLGDGGLQKWSLNTTTGTWGLDYTLSAGLNQVADTGKSGTTGLIGLTGQVVGGNVQLFATNSTIGDTDQTYLYTITDSLGATSLPTSEAFTSLMTAAADTNIRGIAFAPSPACYCAGTLILTDAGERPVESLQIGDRVVTESGATMPIRWIGRRRYTARLAASSQHLRPVRIRAGALGGGLPRRDLRVSPMHAMYIDGKLIPAWLLIDGSAIVQETALEAVQYFHVELARHDVILAEGAPAESFLDDDSRFVFENARDFAMLYGEQSAPPAYCAERLESGPALEAIRARLRAVHA